VADAFVRWIVCKSLAGELKRVRSANVRDISADVDVYEHNTPSPVRLIPARLSRG